jgi:zinc protease
MDNMSSSISVRQQPPAPLRARPIILPKASETTLANGLQVVVVEDSKLPLVSYRLAFRSGDADDPAELPGLTDMMAGLLSEGTESRTSRQIAEEVARIGASLTAGANSDYTTVAASSLADFSDQILELMADVTLHPSFPENEVELTRQNTIESLKQQRAQPSFLATEMVSRVMYGHHPYSVVAPTPESINATSRERLIEFHRSRLVPNNAVLILVGDLKTEPTLKKIEELFGKWEPRSISGEKFPDPPQRQQRSAYIIDRPGSAQSNIVIANLGITRTSPDYFPMLLMHTVLGANASSRLFMNLREEKGYTYGAYSNLDARRSAGTFRATAEVRTPVTGDSLKEFFYELTRIRNERVSDSEMKDAKSYLTGVFPIRLETQEGLIDQFVQIKMFGLPDDYLLTYRDRVQAVTLGQVQEVAERYIRPDKAAIVIVGDGRQIVDQVAPYAGADIEFYNTAGKRKERPSTTASSAGAVLAKDVEGRWRLEIETPLGQNIPASLILKVTDSGITGQVESEMGNAVLKAATLEGSAFTGILSFNMDGHEFEAQLIGDISADQIVGTISLEDTPPLSFTGTKEE